ncbi:putative coiled-coil domain-containing protein 144B [Antechinus flavipes]|uniref:putative coiled-coil domain-containing protein 144B n=1 Tax=Antechinus flavipes TaxID=38775 RepID=UPI002235EBAD|nr:putative coiled-coil domain-containing protein 144B [Antechinus flavipes]
MEYQTSLGTSQERFDKGHQDQATSPRKCKKKTKHLETSDQSNYYDDYNSAYEQNYYYDDYNSASEQNYYYDDYNSAYEQNNYYDDYNFAYALSLEMDSLPYRDRISKIHLDKELRQDSQILTNELRMLPAESLPWEKEKIQPQKEVEEKRQKHHQNKMETLRRKDSDSMESHQHGKDEESKISGEGMNISSRKYLDFVHVLKR